VSASSATGDPPVLAVEAVTAGYLPEVDVVSDVDIRVLASEIVTIVGPNGAGKSTLLKAVFGLLTPRAGRVLLRGDDVTGARPHLITRRGVAYVPQLDNVFPSLSVEENLELGLIGVGARGSRSRMGRMYELFPRLAERRRQAAGTLSGGERQMLAMARALVPEPGLILLDEPSAGLAPQFIDAVFDTVARIKDAGVAVLMVEQNARRALAMSDRGYVLDLGRNRFEGPGKELLEDSHVAELYLGGGKRTAERAGSHAQRVGDADGPR
jgi:neutral amino acid transport system ATP-binding protein